MSLSLYAGPSVEPLTVAEVKAHLQRGVTFGEPSPTAPTLALAGAGSGSITNGAHRVAITFVTADGETELGQVSSAVTVTDNTADGKLAVTSIPLGGANVTARKVYLLPASGSSYLLAATLADNTTTSTTLNLADASLGAAAPSTNTTVDPEIRRYISTARVHVENFIGRKLINQTWDWKHDAAPCGAYLELPFPTVSSITSISYIDSDGNTQTWDAANYQTDLPAGDWSAPARIAPAQGVSWPTVNAYRFNVFTVRFVCGYGAAASSVPAPIRSAMLMLIGHWYANRESVVVGTSAQEMPDGVTQMLWPFKSFAEAA
jgi:uncharacterized phiE125 gp8 family phage protein